MKKSMLAGLGLENLNATPAQPAQAAGEGGFGLFLLLEKIEPDPAQPRKLTAEAQQGLQDLAASILQHGILQPIVVSALGDGRYQIVSGERRWQAAKIAAASGRKCARRGYDLTRIPVVIQDPKDENDRLEMQMVENLAREDMSDVDVGRALGKLLTKLGISKAELARRVGRSETWIKTVLAKASPEADAVAARIGVSPDSIGAGDMLRLISWSNDAEKQVVLDEIAQVIRGGAPYSRSLIDAAESRYEVAKRFPSLAGRTDLSLDDLDTFQRFWSSNDPAQRAVAQRILNGATLADAMAAPAPNPVALVREPRIPDAGPADEAVGTEPAYEAAEANSPGMPPALLDGEFEASDEEVMDVAACRNAQLPAGLVGEPGRRAMDTAGMVMEAAGTVPMADEGGFQDVSLRIPADLVSRLLARSGLPAGLAADADTVLQAIRSLVE